MDRLQYNDIRREAADEIERLQAENAALKARTVAPTDNGIAYLDSICSKFNDGKIGPGALVCRIWNNRQKEVGALEARVAELEEGIARCRQQASYHIGNEEALKNQLTKVRDIANEVLISKGVSQ